MSIQNFQRLPTLGDVLSNVPFVGNYINGDWSVTDEETGRTICKFDTFIGYRFSGNSSVPSMNIEEGSFASYNKINQPDNLTVTLACSGSPAELNSTLSDLERYSRSTKLVNIVLPFKTYLSMNITNVNHGRVEGESSRMLIVELSLQEISQQLARYTTDTKPLSSASIANPQDASTIDRGKQQVRDLSIIRSWLS